MISQASAGLALFQQSHELLLQRFLELERQKLSSDVVDRQLLDLADRIIQEHNTSALIAGKHQLNESDEKEFRQNVRGLMGGGALVPLLERADVENIHVLGHDKVILSLADGRRIPGPPLAGSEDELVMMIRHLAATAGHTSRRFDTASPILDLRLASGHRLFAVTAVAERTSMVIRRHRMLQSSLDNLVQSGTVTPEMSIVLKAAVHPPNPANLLVVGGTGAGKTTLLRSLLSEVPQSELIVTIEDTLELHLRSSGLHDRTLALETRTSNTEGMGEISMYDLCKAALRMSPDRVMVGEVRGGEIMQLLQSMGIGNDGSMGTIHAGSTRAAINKMLIYAQRSPDAPTPDSVLREIAEVMHLLVYIKKLPDGRRAITSIREITGYEEGQVITEEVFAPGPDGTGVYVRPFDPDGEALARLRASGFDPAVLGEPQRHLRAKTAATPSQPEHAPAQPGFPAPGFPAQTAVPAQPAAGAHPAAPAAPAALAPAPPYAPPAPYPAAQPQHAPFGPPGQPTPQHAQDAPPQRHAAFAGQQAAPQAPHQPHAQQVPQRAASARPSPSSSYWNLPTRGSDEVAAPAPQRQTNGPQAPTASQHRQIAPNGQQTPPPSDGAERTADPRSRARRAATRAGHGAA